jgi:hypothetical protein
VRKAFNETIADPEFLAEAARSNKEIQLVTGEELDALVHRVLNSPKSAIDLLKTTLSASAK